MFPFHFFMTEARVTDLGTKVLYGNHSLEIEMNEFFLIRERNSKHFKKL